MMGGEGTSNIVDKLRILCLHGYRQNGDAFKSKLGSFRKQLNKYAEFVFVTAPHQVPPEIGLVDSDQTDNPADDQQKSWWFNHDNGTFKGTNQNGPAFGFEESVRLIETVWKEQGPFHGLLGFSQGACFVGLLCSLSEKGVTNIKPNFAILSSGFKSGSLVHMNYYEEQISIPSLHIYGQTDDIIPSEMSKKLAETFANTQILEHSGGHYFPATTKQKQTYINYFQDLLQTYLEQKELENANGSNTFELQSDSN